MEAEVGGEKLFDLDGKRPDLVSFLNPFHDLRAGRSSFHAYNSHCP